MVVVYYVAIVYFYSDKYKDMFQCLKWTVASRQMRLISYSGDQKLLQIGSHWPNKKRWAIA